MVRSVQLPLSIRPVRIGLLVRRGSYDDLIRACTISTALWGGLFNPLIPVSDELKEEWVDVLIQRFMVDVLLPVSRTDEIERVVARHPELRWPGVFSKDQELIQEGFRGREYRPVDIRTPLSHYWRREFRHTATSRAMIPEWPADHARDGLYSAMFGSFPRGESLPNLRDEVRDKSRATVFDLSTAGFEEMTGANAPIHLTTLGLHVEGPFAGRALGGFVFVDPGNLDHLLLFWNLRASGVAVLPCVRDAIEEFAPLFRDHVARLLEAGRRPVWAAEGAAGVEVWFAHELDEEVWEAHANGGDVPEELRAMFPEETQLMLNELGGWSWDSPGLAHFPPRSEGKTSLCLLDEGPGGDVTLTVPVSDHPFPDADAELVRFSRQQWVWSLRAYGGGGITGQHARYTLRLPFLRDLNEWVSRQMHPTDPFSIRLQPEGFDVIGHVSDPTLWLRVLGESEVLHRVMERAALSTEVSDAGLRARRIQEMFGGLRYLEVFKAPGVRSLLTSAARRKPLLFRQACELIRDHDSETRLTSFQRFRERWRRGSRSVSEVDVFRMLLANEVFRPALRLKCTHCRLDVEIEPEQLGQEVTCPLCANKFPLGIQLTSGAKWVYLLSGIFSHPSGDQGALPTLLAMAALEGHGLTNYSIAEAAHCVSGRDLECETDLLLLEIDQDGAPSVCVGECKDQGRISRQDAENLGVVRESLRSSGVECYVLFATMRDSFDEEELDLFREVSDGWVDELALNRFPGHVESAPPPILFTRGDLEADWLFRERGEDVPHAHPVSLRDLAENSQAVYLGDRQTPSWYRELQ